MRHSNVSVILIIHILKHSFYFASIPCYIYMNTSKFWKLYNCIIFQNIITKYGILQTKSPPSLRDIQAYCDNLSLQIYHYLLSYCGTSQYNTLTLLSISLWQSQVWYCATVKSYILCIIHGITWYCSILYCIITYYITLSLLSVIEWHS